MGFETTKCVVLNSTYEPISITSPRRALRLILKSKAVVVEEHPYLEIRSSGLTFKVPVMVALKVFVKARKIFRTKAALTQKNLFIRDNYTCQYCDRHRSELRSFEFLTRDHIIPESKGGKNTWENLVTACSTCNNKKADYFLSQVTMQLAKEPTAPTLFELWMKNNSKKLPNF
jgi:5-methylcytosine-specific restriction endonuclease McrA